MSLDFFGLPASPKVSVDPVPDYRGSGKTPVRDKFDVFEAMHGPPVEDSPDLERILALPRRPQIDLRLDESPKAQALVEIMNERLRRPDWQRKDCKCASIAPERGESACITTLKPAQAWALYEAPLMGGLLGTIAAGTGKTGIGLLMPTAFALAGWPCDQTVGLVPANLVKQLVREHALWAEHWRVPNLVLGAWNGAIDRGRSGVLHVVPYSKLSATESTKLLKERAPKLIYADEMHKLAHLDTARTSRFARLFAEIPETRFCGWSGTPWDKSILEAAHLATYALRHGSPLPLDSDQQRVWAAALDPTTYGGSASPGALKKLCVAGEEVRDAFKRRLLETPGVVATREGAVDVPLRIYERDPGEIPEALKQMINETNDKRPDGEELLDALQQAKVKSELVCGFYYRWIFPREPRIPGTKRLTPEAVEKIERWRARRKEWRSELREMLEGGDGRPARQEHLDSEQLCTNAAQRYYIGRRGVEGETIYEGDLPTWASQHYLGWMEVKDTVYHETVPVWVDDYLVDDAVAWAREHRGVIWTEHTAFAHRVAEKGGFPYYGGGPNAEARILADRGETSIVASIDSHGTGRDGLQYLFNEQLIVGFPSSGKLAEQLLARLHRVGQLKPVHTWVYRHTPELRQAMKTAASRGAFVNETWGASQKLLLAEKDFELGLGMLGE